MRPCDYILLSQVDPKVNSETHLFASAPQVTTTNSEEERTTVSDDKFRLGKCPFPTFRPVGPGNGCSPHCAASQKGLNHCVTCCPCKLSASRRRGKKQHVNQTLVEPL